jgi:hypothetical protein
MSASDSVVEWNGSARGPPGTAPGVPPGASSASDSASASGASEYGAVECRDAGRDGLGGPMGRDEAERDAPEGASWGNAPGLRAPLGPSSASSALPPPCDGTRIATPHTMHRARSPAKAAFAAWWCRQPGHWNSIIAPHKRKLARATRSPLPVTRKRPRKAIVLNTNFDDVTPPKVASSPVRNGAGL